MALSLLAGEFAYVGVNEYQTSADYYDPAIYAAGSNTIYVNGGVVGPAKGIRSFGTSATYNTPTSTFIAETGHVYGDVLAYALIFGGDTINNHGTIYSDRIAIGTESTYNGVFSYLSNSGKIIAGVQGTGQENAAIYTLAAAGETTKISNEGLIKTELAGSFAINHAGNSQDTVINAGTIVGRVALGGGTDFFDTREGKLVGAVSAGAGADVVHGNAAGNQIAGGNQNDNLRSYAGADLLAGNAGNDTLAGGLDADTFRFDAALSATLNVDVISDFASVDTIQLENAIFTQVGPAGRLSAGALANWDSADQADDRIIYRHVDSADAGTVKDTIALYYDANGASTSDAVLFARLTGQATVSLAAADFLVA